MLMRINRKLRDEDGFTLIELMVVVLIIGILIAIALPTFLGARKRAQDRAAQSDLRNALVAAKTYFTDGDTYVGFNAAAGAAIESSLTWVDGAGVTAGDAYVNIDPAGTTASTIVMNADSASGNTFCIADNSAAGGTVRGKGTAASYAACAALPDF